MMGAADISETSTDFYQATGRGNPEGSRQQKTFCELLHV
jgi:hypothetical protein